MTQVKWKSSLSKCGLIFMGLMLANPSQAALPRSISISTKKSFQTVDLNQGEALPASGLPRQMALAKRACRLQDCIEIKRDGAKKPMRSESQRRNKPQSS